LVARVVDLAGEGMTGLYGDPGGNGGLFRDEGPGDEAEAFRVSPCTVPGIPACTVCRSYHWASLCLKYPGEREGEPRPSPSAAQRPLVPDLGEVFGPRLGRAHFWVCGANPCERGGFLRSGEGAIRDKEPRFLLHKNAGRHPRTP
jgi:hypothetical protein